MTDEELAAIRERSEAATPGPWQALHRHTPTARHRVVRIRPAAKPTHWGPTATDPILRSDTSRYTPEGDQFYNVEFAAHARQDIPALLAEIERLRGHRQRTAGGWVLTHEGHERVTTP